MSVQLPSSLRSLRTEIVRSPCGDRPSHGARAGIVQCHLRHVYGIRSYNFSKFVKLLAKPNRRGRGARESVRKSHSRLLPPHGGLAEAARKGGYAQDTGSVDPSQAKCELGMHKWFLTKEVSGLFGIDTTDLNRSAGKWLRPSLFAVYGSETESGEKWWA